MRNLHSLLAVPLLTLACGANQPPPASPPGGETGPVGDASADAAARPFDELNHRERIEVMKTVVVPRLKPVFQELDATHFAEFSCSTCHGPGAERGEFEMPSAALPKLPAQGAFDALLEEQPAVMDVMMHQVLPEMASALGESPFDPATGEGFSCYDCHMSE